MDAHPKKQLPVDLGELEMALETNDESINYYLDLTSGEILVMTDDMRMALDDFLDETDVDTDDREAVLRVVREQEDPALLEAYQIREDKSGRYLEIRQSDKRASYRAMEAFIEQLENRALQNHLYNSIRMKGAFRNFKNTLSRFPKEQQEWYAFKNNLMRQEALHWLAQNGIEPL